MKYQLQLYKQTDHLDRHVIGECEGDLNQEQLGAWYGEKMQSVSVPEGYAVAMVQPDHDWFMIASPVVELVSAELTTEQVLEFGKKQSNEQRLRNIEKRQRVAKLMAELQ